MRTGKAMEVILMLIGLLLITGALIALAFW
jgi:LPXTG-motif cell wall-anchored protein